MLSKRLKELRKQHGWTQQKLAEKAGLSFNAITKIEQGAAEHPTLKTLLKLADVFGVTLDVLVGRNKITNKKGKIWIPLTFITTERLESQGEIWDFAKRQEFFNYFQAIEKAKSLRFEDSFEIGR